MLFAYIDAITIYLRDYHNFIPECLRIDLQFQGQTGITAESIAD
nr:hypothetical protein [Ectobacillus panaciterrae]